MCVVNCSSRVVRCKTGTDTTHEKAGDALYSLRAAVVATSD